MDCFNCKVKPANCGFICHGCDRRLNPSFYFTTPKPRPVDQDAEVVAFIIGKDAREISQGLRVHVPFFPDGRGITYLETQA